MATVTLTSNYNTDFSQTFPFEKNSCSQENHARKASEPGPDLISPNMSGRKKEEDGEIGVFRAEKYFNGGIEADSPRITKIDSKRLESLKSERVNLEPFKPVIHQQTPSVRSESSWNSQSALLQSVMRNPPRPKPNKVNGKSFFSTLASCNCYCIDRNSVDIEEQVGEISFKRPSNGESKQFKAAAKKQASVEVNKPPPAEPWIKEDLFTFPTTNSNMGIRPVKVPLQGEVDEIGRRSLEVFGSPALGRRHKSLNLERRLKMLSWDPSPKPEETDNPKGNYSIDTESDASSDLFEIESLTGKANPFLARQASDVASGCVTPTTCYAPSEASIEWSVVTASAADFSAMSDYEELRPSTTTIPSPIKTFPSATINVKTENDKQVPRRRSSGLLGCNSQKAVKVAGDAYRTNENKPAFDPIRIRRVSDTYMPATRFRAETNLPVFEPSQTPRFLATHSLPHSHSPQAFPSLVYSVALE